MEAHPAPSTEIDPGLGPASRWLGSLVEPLTLLPSQVGVARRFHRQPEKVLMAAVLRTALIDLVRYGSTPGSRRRGKYTQALNYIMSNDRRWPFAFVNLCEALGIDPRRIRNAILGASAS